MKRMCRIPLTEQSNICSVSHYGDHICFDESVFLGKFIQKFTVFTYALMGTISQKYTFIRRKSV